MISRQVDELRQCARENDGTCLQGFVIPTICRNAADTIEELTHECGSCIWEVCNYNKVDWDNAENTIPTDYISIQAAMEAFCDDCRGIKPGQCEHWDICESQNVLRSLPPSERESGWIPVSERLPEVGEHVLASVHDDYADFNIIINKYVEQAFWDNGRITAWQPLPEPYKGGDDNE